MSFSASIFGYCNVLHSHILEHIIFSAFWKPDLDPLLGDTWAIWAVDPRFQDPFKKNKKNKKN